jgi:membrane-associated phospholipid phosphatase
VTGIVQRVPVAVAACLGLALVLGVLSWSFAGPVPLDVTLTRGLQAGVPLPFAWPELLSPLGKMPWVVVTIVVAAGLAALPGGWRGALAAPVAYGLARVADLGLRAVLFVPRPDPTLVEVAHASSSSGLPSTFGLTFGALFSLPFWLPGGGSRSLAARSGACAILVLGGLARILPGGHWPSQMLASVALGAVLAWLAVALVARASGGARQ